VQVHALHEERPLPCRQGPEVRGAERAVLQRVARALAQDEPRLDVVATGEREELLAPEHAGEAGNCRAHQQRLPLPVPREKGERGAAA